VFLIIFSLQEGLFAVGVASGISGWCVVVFSRLCFVCFDCVSACVLVNGFAFRLTLRLCLCSCACSFVCLRLFVCFVFVFLCV